MEKAVSDQENFIKEQKEKIAKAKAKKPKSGDDIVKAVTDELGGKIDALLTLNQKTNSELEKAHKTVELLGARLEALENQTPAPKSFRNVNFIEKAFTENKETGRRKVSMSAHNKELKALLADKAGFNKGEVVPFYNEAAKYFDANNSLTEAVIRDLFANGIEITK
jgi:hypothetical protein